jgi:hypothetical protein
MSAPSATSAVWFGWAAGTRCYASLAVVGVDFAARPSSDGIQSPGEPRATAMTTTRGAS